MSGEVKRVLRRTTFEFTAAQAVSSTSPEVAIATNVNVSQYRELILIARLHSATWTSAGAKFEIRVRGSAPTEEDPGLTFRGTTVLTSVTLNQGSVVPFPAFGTMITGFPPFVDVLVFMTQGAQAAAGTVNVSADISLRS